VRCAGRRPAPSAQAPAHSRHTAPARRAINQSLLHSTTPLSRHSRVTGAQPRALEAENADTQGRERRHSRPRTRALEAENADALGRACSGTPTGKARWRGRTLSAASLSGA
jgi:hypothetical protein